MRSARLALFALFAATAGAFAEPLTVEVRQIENFGSGVGADSPLEFLGGLDVSSPSWVFGGLSGIDMIDADTALMIGDSSTYVTARLVHGGGRLVGLADAEIGSLFPDGDMSKEFGTPRSGARSDARSRACSYAAAGNAMLTFDSSRGVRKNFEPNCRRSRPHPRSKHPGSERRIRAGGPARGQIVTIGERPMRGEDDLRGWIAGKGTFSIVRRDSFDVSSARFLPNGDLILLERRYAPAWGIAMRLRRIAGDTIKAGARLDGDILLDAGMTSQIDNMEGLAVSRTKRANNLTLYRDN